MKEIRKEEEKFKDSLIFEGFVSINSVIKGYENNVHRRKIEKIMFDGAKEKSKSRELKYLFAKSKELGFEIEKTTADEISNITIGNTHGGVIAICSERAFSPISKDDISKNGFYVMLEGIEDPYNFGYALRSIYASGADGVILSERNWMSAAGVVARASAGASELMHIYAGDPLEAVELLKSNGYNVLAADKTADSVSIYETDAKFPILLLIGGERRGLSRPILDSADKVIRLDYGRNFSAALSAASAASIISFEIFRQNRGKNESES